MERPTSVVVLGILNIVFGVIGMCGVCVGAFGLFSGNATEGLPPFMVEIFEHPLYVIWTWVSFPISAVTTIMLLAGGVLLLQMRPEGRKLSLWYAWIALLMGLLGTGITLMLMLGPALSAMSSSGDEMAAVMAISMLIGIPCGLACSLIYPIVLIYFLNRPHVIAALEHGGQFPPQGGPPPPTGYWPPPPQ